MHLQILHLSRRKALTLRPRRQCLASCNREILQSLLQQLRELRIPRRDRLTLSLKVRFCGSLDTRDPVKVVPRTWAWNELELEPRMLEAVGHSFYERGCWLDQCADGVLPDDFVFFVAVALGWFAAAISHPRLEIAGDPATAVGYTLEDVGEVGYSATGDR